MKHINTYDFSSPKTLIPIIDVRSPLEFQKGHINGAVNIPLFSNDERKEIGIIYKNLGRDNAIEKGLGIVGPKMMKLALQAKELSNSNERKVYCWRGGMRSEKMSWLFETIGMNCNVLEGGYKAYRNQIIMDFKKIRELIILHGSTGSGKTDILGEMLKNGEQIIDLEKLAIHKGSAFGHIGMSEQPTSQQFQNDVHNALLNLNPKKRIWIECESLKISSVNLPDALWERMKSARVFEINVERSTRLKRLNQEYGNLPKDQLINSINRLNGQISKEKLSNTVNLLRENKTISAIEIILDYYDRTYDFTKKRFGKNSLFSVYTNSGDAKINMELLLKELKNIDKN